MSWVAAAIVGSALIGSMGSQSAAQTQASSQNQASQTQQNMFNTVQANSQPFMQAGYSATSDLSQLMGLSGSSGTSGGGMMGGTSPTPSIGGVSQGGGTVGNTGLPAGYLTQTFNPTQDQLNQYPGYQFALQTGAQATRNADTPGVGALSGAALKDLTNFDVGTANQNYSNYFNQFQTQQNNIYQRLSSIAGLGQSAAAGVGNSGTQLGTGIAQSQAASGASTAAGIVGSTNAISGGLNSLAGMMYLNGGSSSGVSASALKNANASTDPLGTLAAQQGWTTAPGG
jgi:hypothetical protein